MQMQNIRLTRCIEFRFHPPYECYAEIWTAFCFPDALSSVSDITLLDYGACLCENGDSAALMLSHMNIRTMLEKVMWILALGLRQEKRKVHT
jgi:hypothetical protein